MSEDIGDSELKAELERKHFARAALVAASLGVEEEELRELQLEAIWQMSAEFRNAPGTKSLSEKYGFSKKEVDEFLRTRAEQKRKAGEHKVLEPCYDQGTGRYLDFDEWEQRLIRNWDKLSLSRH